MSNEASQGYEWVDWEARTDGGDVVLGTAKILRVNDVPKFERAFPGVIQAALDGQSIRVTGQRVVRDALIKDHGAYREVLKAKVLSTITKMRPAVVTKVYALPDGTTTTSEAEFRTAWNLPAATTK